MPKIDKILGQEIDMDNLPNFYNEYEYDDTNYQSPITTSKNFYFNRVIKILLLPLLLAPFIIIWTHFSRTPYVTTKPIPETLLPKITAINTTPLIDNLTPTTPLTIPLSNNGQKALTVSDQEFEYTAVTIDKSIYLAGKNAGLSAKIISKLIGIFNDEINFSRDIRDGDKFTMLYRKLPPKAGDIDKKSVNYEILAAEITSHHKVHRAIRFTDKNGHTDYYTPDGYTLKSPFVRYPTSRIRISSRFSYHRWHPILHFFRSHLGVDFAGPIGMPIQATGDGRIVFMGIKGNYGKTVIVQHDNKYSTLYAHLSRFPKKVHSGSLVHKQQIIGFIGSSGLSTGPHVHYEFRVYGVQHDPLKIRLPHLSLVLRSDRIKFFAKSKFLLAELHEHYPQFAINNVPPKLPGSV